MNKKEAEALKEQLQQVHECNCTNKKNKPSNVVCVRCGKCHHAACILKKNDAYHIIGNLINCCSLEPKYLEQELEVCIKNLEDEKIKCNNLTKENKALIEDINELHKTAKENDPTNLTIQELMLRRKIKLC